MLFLLPVATLILSEHYLKTSSIYFFGFQWQPWSYLYTILKLVQNNFVKFGALVKKGNGSFLIVSDINFDENLNIVPTLQEAYDFIDMEEMERQLN